MIINNGTAGTTSLEQFHNPSTNINLPKYAFQNTSNYWFSEGGMPQSAWMQFPTPHEITKIGFSSIYNSYAPKRFDVIGSSNCAAPWTVLLRINDAGFPNDYGNEFKLWSVPADSQRPFTCLGLKIETTGAMEDYPHVALKNIEMWEKAA